MRRSSTLPKRNSASDLIPTKLQSSASAPNVANVTFLIFTGLEEARRENFARFAKLPFKRHKTKICERRIK
jgi:hypothetical protein